MHRPKISPKKRLFFRLFCLLLMCLLAEGIMYIKLWRSGKDLIPYTLMQDSDISAFENWLGQKDSYLAYDPLLGWDIQASTQKVKNSKDENYSYQANAQGIRDPRIFSETPEAGKIRILAIGDSFTHGDEVSLEDTWIHLLEKQLGSSYEILNLGVSGYGTDQALLKLEHKGLKFKPHIVILSIMTENICRNVNRFRPYYAGSQTGLPLTKPRFLKEGEGLTLASPLTLSPEEVIQALKAGSSRIFEENEFFYNAAHYEDHWYYRIQLIRCMCHKMIRHQWKASKKWEVLYNPQNEPFQILARLLFRFKNICETHHILPVVVLQYHKPDFSEKKQYWNSLSSFVTEHFSEKAPQAGIGIDLFPELNEDPSFKTQLPQMFQLNGHYSRLGNQKIANILFQHLLKSPFFQSLSPKKQ
jgi:hypothetical protein